MLWSIDSCQKGICWPVSPDRITGSNVQLIEVTCFLKLSADQLLVLTDHSLGSIMKRPYNKLLINLIRSIITGISQTWPWSIILTAILLSQYTNSRPRVCDYPLMTSLSVNKQYVICSCTASCILFSHWDHCNNLLANCCFDIPVWWCINYSLFLYTFIILLKFFSVS